MVGIIHTKNIMRHIDGMTIKRVVDTFPDAAEIWPYWTTMSFLGFEIQNRVTTILTPSQLSITPIYSIPLGGPVRTANTL